MNEQERNKLLDKIKLLEIEVTNCNDRVDYWRDRFEQADKVATRLLTFSMLLVVVVGGLIYL